MILRLVCIILSLLSLSGCSDGTCLDADDFGFAHVVVPARYDSSDLQGQQDNQIAPWLNTGYTVNGTPLVVVVKNWNAHDNTNTANQLSAWCPWYGGNSGATGISSLLGNLSSVIPIGDTNSFKNGLSTICQGLAVCQWVGDEMCTETVDAQILNAPCLLTKGVGLYALITGPYSDPNASNATNVNPSTMFPAGIALHVGAKHDDYTLYDVDPNGKYSPAGGIIYQYDDPTLYNNGGLYFKILDKHYGDNSGQYLVTIKSGVSNDIPDPIQFITNMVAQYIFGSAAFLNNPGDAQTQSAVTAVFSGVTLNKTGVVQAIYQSLIQNPFYKNFVRGCLSLYVMLTGLYYLAGLLQVTTKEVIARVIKIAIIAALLDPNIGWSFFHDNLFVFFIEGVQEMIYIIQTAAATGPGPTSIISLMIAPQTLTKLITLLFTSWFGILYIIFYFLIFIFITSVTFRAAVLYLNCLIMIGMIIIMGPIFLCFMLFNWTKGLFENWLKQLISYALQPIILITSLAFVSILVRHEIYATLGFPVCRQYFLPSPFDLVDPSGTSSSIFSWWFPSPMDGKFSSELVTIPVPEAHSVLDSNGNQTGVYCDAYACNEPRYVQLPFLDPNSPSDMVRKDNFFEGSFTQILGLIYIVVLCYLMNKFNESAVTIARALTETSSNATSMDRATQTPGFTDMVKGVGIAAKSAAKGAAQLMSKRGVINPGGGGSPSATGAGATRAGLIGSKDDGSGTKSESKLQPSAHKIDDKTPVWKTPLKEGVTSKFNEKNEIKEGVKIQDGKKGSVDDIGIRNSTTKEKTRADVMKDLMKPLPSGKKSTDAAVAAERNAPTPSLASSKTAESTSSSSAEERKMPTPSLASSKTAENTSSSSVEERKMPIQTPDGMKQRPKSTPVGMKEQISASSAEERKMPTPSLASSKTAENSSSSSAVERKMPTQTPDGMKQRPTSTPVGVKEQISASSEVERKAPTPPTTPSKIEAITSAKTTTESALPIPKPSITVPSVGSNVPPPPPAAAPRRTTTENRENYAADPKTKDKIAKGRGGVGGGFKKSASAPSSPRSLGDERSMLTSRSAPELGGKKARDPYGDTVSSAERSKGNKSHRQEIEADRAAELAKRPKNKK